MKQTTKSAVCAALLLCLLTGCGARQTTASQISEQHASSKQPPVSAARSEKASSSAVLQAVSSEASAASSQTEEQTELDNMTLSQKVGQLFFLCFRKDTDGTNLFTYNDTVKNTIQAIQPGGIVLFGENIHTTAQVRRLIQNMQQDCKTPPFVGIDQEGGAVQRVTETELIPATVVPSMWRVGQTGSTALAKQVGGVLASELSVFGFNLDFAPDCDVFSNLNNTVIGTRAFSSDPQQAAVFSTAVSAGIRGQGVIPVCKHFPGHGDTEADTHEGYAVVNKTLEQLQKTELVPFEAQIKAGAEMIMAAHISLPKINGDNTPASMSKKVLQGLLREELDFSGVIITDALNMGAVADNYTSGEAAVRAVQAGADMLLMPEDPQAAYNAVRKAVQDGTIPQSRIEESVKRILALKKKYKLFSKRELGDESLLGCEEHQQVVAQIG